MRFVPISLLMVIGCLLAVWEVSFEGRSPGVDIFLFKGPAHNLAEKGALVASNLPHLAPDTEKLYAYYPPIYPVVFGLYSKVIGSSSRASLAFEWILRILRSLLLFLLIAQWSGRKPGWMTAIVLGLSTLITSDLDRPDELAIVWGALALWFYGQRRSLVSGLALGLCGATSPTAGLFFALMLFGQTTNLLELVKAVAVSAGLFAGVVLVLYLHDPTVLTRFLSQTPYSTFGYLKIPHPGGKGAAFLEDMGHFVRWGRNYFLLWVVLLGIYFALTKKLTLTVGILIFFSLLSPLVWSLQPYYLWFPICLLMVLALSAIQDRVKFAAAVMVAMLPLAFPLLVKDATAAFRNFGETSRGMRVKLERVIEPGARVAVTPTHYFVLKGVRDVVNLKYNCLTLDRFDFILMPPTSNQKNRSEPLIPCVEKAHCYTLEETLLEPKSVLGTDYLVPGFGGYLFKRTKCPKPY